MGELVDRKNANAVGIATDLRQCFETRLRHIRELREFADNHDQLARKFNDKRQAPLGVKIAGGVATVVGGGIAIATTVFTMGTAAPIWAGAFGLGGTALGVGGGAWSIALDLEKKKGEKLLMERMAEILQEDAEMQKKAKRALENVQMLEFSETRKAMESVRLILNLYLGVNLVAGSTIALSVVAIALTPMATFCGPVATVCSALAPVLAKATEEVGKLLGSEVADDIAAETVKAMNPGITKMVAQHQAAQAAKGVVNTDLAKEVYQKLMKEAAEKAAKEATKTVTKITGSLTILLGATFAIWDTVELVEAKRDSQEGVKSKMGEALRKSANEAEKELRRNRG